MKPRLIKHKQFDEVCEGDIFTFNTMNGNKKIIIATSSIDSGMDAGFSYRELKDGNEGIVFRHLYRFLKYVGRECESEGEMVEILFT
jgi:hypothetical protein